MNFIRRLIIFTAIVAPITLIIFTKFIFPKYPPINPNDNLEKIHKNINISIQDEITNYYMVGGKDKVAELEESISELTNDFKACGRNKECIINAYNNFMDENVSPQTKMRTQLQYLMKQGAFGQLLAQIIISSKLFFLYEL